MVTDWATVTTHAGPERPALRAVRAEVSDRAAVVLGNQRQRCTAGTAEGSRATLVLPCSLQCRSLRPCCFAPWRKNNGGVPQAPGLGRPPVHPGRGIRPEDRQDTLLPEEGPTRRPRAPGPARGRTGPGN